MKPVRRQSLRALLALFLAAGSLQAMAETYYRWVNDRGQTMLSDRPPPTGIDYEVVNTGASFSRAVSADQGAVPATTEPGPDSDFLSRNSSAPKTEKNQDLCERARTNMDALTNSDKVTIRNSAGEVRELTAAEIKIQIQTTQAQIEAYCEETSD